MFTHEIMVSTSDTTASDVVAQLTEFSSQNIFERFCNENEIAFKRQLIRVSFTSVRSIAEPTKAPKRVSMEKVKAIG